MTGTPDSFSRKEFTGRHLKSSYDCKYGCAILEELDYLCNLIGLQVPPHATSSDKDTSRTQNYRRISRASSLHMMSLSFAPKLINIPVV